MMLASVQTKHVNALNSDSCEPCLCLPDWCISLAQLASYVRTRHAFHNKYDCSASTCSGQVDTKTKVFTVVKLDASTVLQCTRGRKANRWPALRCQPWLWRWLHGQFESGGKSLPSLRPAPARRTPPCTPPPRGLARTRVLQRCTE
jgi:hypothetical protein